jgi:hypothetical protein
LIQNTKHCGVLSRFLNIEMTNCVISNNGASSLQLEGGNYTLKHVTVGNYFSQADRKAPACYVSNIVSGYDNMFYETTAKFTNCILYGNNKEAEIEVNEKQGTPLAVSFENCIVKVKDKENAKYFTACVRNEDPKFRDVGKQSYRLSIESPAISKGKADIGIFEDISGNQRTNPPDIGAYQYERFIRR